MPEAIAQHLAVLRASPLAIVAVDPQQIVTLWNPAAEKLFGWKEVEVLGRECPSMVPDDRRDEDDAWRTRCLEGREFSSAATVRRRKDGSLVGLWASMAPVRDAYGAPCGTVAFYSLAPETHEEDLASRVVVTPEEGRSLQEKVDHAQQFDPLTGLPNRFLFHRRAAEAIGRAKERQGSVAILLIDLDRFKTVNDSLGQSAGDSILIQVADRLREQITGSDTVARLGEDQYAALLTSADEAQAVILGREILEQLAVPYSVAGQSIRMTASIGVTLYPRDGATLEDLLRNVDRAMHRAKAEGIGLLFFDQAIDTHGEERLWIETELRQALERGRLMLAFQPIRRLSDGKTVGAEALVRWTHPEKGPIAPGRFIPVAEESSLIVALDRWVVTSAVRQLGRWHKTMPDAWLTANLSPRSLHDPDFPARVKALVTEFGADPSRLVLEITERVLADPGHTLGSIRRLRDIGLRIAVDDFGTGYSSLVYLQEFPLDFLKVDQQFVRSIGSHPKGEAIARTVIALSHNLGVDALAEGIEEKSQLDWLTSEKCDFGQGYHLGKPLPVSEFRSG